jgi:peptidoglycan-N-acetylglucosamine deacetylase
MKYRAAIITSLMIAILIIANTFILYYFVYLPSQIRPVPNMAGKIFWHGNSKLPEIALTFDDGPSHKNTPIVLDILKKNDVKATFFVLGKFVLRNKDVLKQEYLDGHVIGNHTFNHAKGSITDIKKIKAELMSCDKAVYDITGTHMKYFRPPFGYENWRFLTEAELDDYTVILWTVDVGDWNATRTKSEIISRVEKNTRNGSIILLHDGGASREAVVEALPTLIKDLKQKGYKFVTIPEMIDHLK